MGEQRDANAGVHIDVFAVHRIRHRDRPQHPVQRRTQLRQIAHITQYEHEFVTGQPRHHILAAHDVAQTSGHFHQQQIATGMPVTIVDGLEAIEIEHAYRQRDTLLAREFQRLIQQFREKHAIGQPGQYIVPDPPLEGMQQLMLLTDVKAYGDITLDPSGDAVEQGHHGAFDPIQAAVLGAIADYALPDASQGDGAPHSGKKLSGVDAGIKHAVVLPEQFLTAVAGNGAELIVDVGDPAGKVGLGKDSGGIDGPAVFLIHESDSLLLAVA